MNEKTKTTIKVGLVASLLVVTGVFIYPEKEVAETDLEVTIEDKGQPYKEMRIVPKQKIPAFSEGHFTVNDIISEIEIELRRSGGEENDRVKELRNMLEKFDKKSREVEDARPKPIPGVTPEPVIEEITE